MPSSDNLLPVETSAAQQDLIGNIVSGGGGYIAAYNGTFYFANPDDQYKLYQMDGNFANKKKLSDRPNVSSFLQIQISNDKLFYLQSASGPPDALYDVLTLYQYDLIQGVETAVLDRNILSFILNGDWIYFSDRETLDIFKARLDGTDIQLLDKGNAFLPLSIQVSANQLFYGWDEAIVQLDLTNQKQRTWPANPYVLLVYEQFVYYVNLLTGELHKFNPADEAADPSEMTLVDEDVLSFTISENVLYYSTLHDKIYKTDLNGNNPECIAEGNAPVVLGPYLFYYNMDGKMVQVQK